MEEGVLEIAQQRENAVTSVREYQKLEPTGKAVCIIVM